MRRTIALSYRREVDGLPMTGLSQPDVVHGHGIAPEFTPGQDRGPVWERVR